MPRKRDLETVAAIVVDATLLEGGAKAAAEKWGVTERTVWRYKSQARKNGPLKKLVSQILGADTRPPDAAKALRPKPVPTVTQAIERATAAIHKSSAFLEAIAERGLALMEAQTGLEEHLRELLRHLREVGEAADMLKVVVEIRETLRALGWQLDPETLKAVALHTEVISRSRTEMAGVEMARESSERLYRLLEAQLQAGSAQGPTPSLALARPN